MHERTTTAYRPTALPIIGLLLTLGFTCLPVSKWEDEFADVAHLVGYELIWWAMVVFVLCWVRFLERRPLPSLGFRSLHRWDVVTTLAAAVVMMAGLAGIYYFVLPRVGADETAPIDQLLATPLWWRVISVIRAGVAEEIIFRGYAIGRLADVSGSVGIAATVSWAVFTVAHVGPWGFGHLLLAGYGGLVLTVLWLRRRNLWVNILAHVLVDAAAVLPG